MFFLTLDFFSTLIYDLFAFYGNTGKIKIISSFNIWNLELVFWNLFEV